MPLRPDDAVAAAGLGAVEGLVGLLDELPSPVSAWSGKVATPRGDKYAYGFIENVEGGVRSFGHGGGAPGMNGDLRIYPDSGYVVAALANTGSGASGLVGWVSERLPVQTR